MNSVQADDRAPVAVIVTSFNQARFLHGSLASVMAQTSQPAEIIVVDDGSSDHPDAVVAHFPGVRLITQRNTGLAAARNTGWRQCTSEFVVFLDADDRLLPLAVATNLASLQTTEAAVFAYGAYVLVDARSGRVSPTRFRDGATYETLLRSNLIEMHGTVMYRRSVLAGVDGFDDSLRACEDYDLYLRLARTGPIAAQNVALAEYWRHESNMSLNSALMLRTSLHVLRSQSLTARQLGLTVPHRIGIVGRKRYFASVWWRACIEHLRARIFNRPLLVQGLLMMRLAPLAMLGSPYRIIAEYLLTRRSGHARAR